MLPGFRFLLAATFLSGSMMVFGLGAAAVLRAAHEEFAYNPSWRAPPEPKFTQSEGAARPNLAMLRVEPRPVQVSEQKTADVTANTPADSPPGMAEPVVGAAPEPQFEKTAARGAQYAWPPFQVEKMTTAVAADRSPTDDAVEQLVTDKPEIDTGPVALSENATASLGAADAETTSPEPAKPELVRPELAEAAKPEAANAEQMGPPSAPEPTGSVTTLANPGEQSALAGQSALTEEPAKVSPKPDENATKARLRAQRARARRLARARLARQQAAAQAQFLFFPFFVQQQQPPPTQQQRRVIQARNP
jgi:hypothetical protein